jgi:hypothetical protein
MWFGSELHRLLQFQTEDACVPEDEALFDREGTMIQATNTLITFIHFMSFFLFRVNKL